MRAQKLEEEKIRTKEFRERSVAVLMSHGITAATGYSIARRANKIRKDIDT